MTVENQVDVDINTNTQSDEHILSIDSLSVEYLTERGPVRALRNVSIELGQGETLGIAGESGSGKSTLALTVLRYLSENGRVSSGTIDFRGKSLLDMSPRELRIIRGNEISHVAQDPRKALNPSIIVGEQIIETIQLHQDVTKKDALQKTYEVLDDVNISDPELAYNQYPHELSGGMQQRILIAMALSCDPDVLILDEPTTGLDVTTQANILNLINDLKNELETSILLITHNLGVISEIADRVAILYAGEIMEQGPTKSIFENPANPYTQGLLATMPDIENRKELRPIPGQIPDLTDIPEGCIFADRCDFVEPECRTGSISLEAAAENHTTRCRRWKTATENPIEPDDAADRDSIYSDTLLEVSNLHKYYDVPSFVDKLFNPNPPVKAVNNVSFNLHESESLALVGESGCGKSTLGRTILDLIESTKGDISFQGNSINDMTETQYHEFRSECQIVFQSPESSLNPRKDIYNSLARPLKLFTEYDENERRRRVGELLTQVGLGPEYASRYPHELSGGEQQRIAIARAFAAEPSFVVLDEPVSSLDVSVQANILNLLGTLREKYNASYLFISHDLSVVRQLCDRIAVMYLGEIVEMGSVREIFNNPQHPYTETLLDSVPALEPHSRSEQMSTLHGEVPSPREPPYGCKFHTRCPHARETCQVDDPEFIAVDGNPEHKAACLRQIDDHDYWQSKPLPHTKETKKDQ